MSNKFDQKWSQLSKADQTAMKDKYDNKQGWQDAKARSEGFMNEQARRKNSGERHLKNNPDYVAPSAPLPETKTATSTNTAPTNDYTSKYGTGVEGFGKYWQAEGLENAKAFNAERDAKRPDSGIARGTTNYSQLSDDGYFTFDASRPIQSFDTTILEKFGIGAGDKLFSPKGYTPSGNNKFTTDGTIQGGHAWDTGFVMPTRIGDGATNY